MPGASNAIAQDAKRGKEESGRLVVPEWHPRPTSIEQLLTDMMGADATTAMERVFTHVAGPEEAELLTSAYKMELSLVSVDWWHGFRWYHQGKHSAYQ